MVCWLARAVGFVALCGWAVLAFGDRALAADPPVIKRVLPPPGIDLPAAEMKTIRARLASAEAQAKAQYGADPIDPDIEIFLKAVRFAVDLGEFFSPGDGKAALKLLDECEKRLAAAKRGEFALNQVKGLVVRGYRSEVDGSVQPFGVEIPADYDPKGKPLPLYIWLHGRGDKMTDLQFIAARMAKREGIQPEQAIVIHPFGRYCNAFKFAGETDVLEARNLALAHYRIDPERVVLCGFSMGGAGAWHLGAHYASEWIAVSPGAGFAETAQYVGLKPENYPPQYEQLLWGLYDVPGYVRNFRNTELIAYSGEIDKQIQAARVMEEAIQADGRTLAHIIGPQTAHKYHPESLKELRSRLAQIAAAGRAQPRRRVSIETRTLRYASMDWVRLLGLGQHWADSRLDAEVADDGSIQITTQNVTAFELRPPTGGATAKFPAEQKLTVDNLALRIAAKDRTRDERGEVIRLVQQQGKWTPVEVYPPAGELRKSPHRQGPIDDFLLSSFLVVTPSGQAAHPAVEKWVAAELAHFQDRYQRLFRGKVRVKQDTEVTAEDAAEHHLILWGDPTSNAYLKQIAAKLPIGWNGTAVTAAGKSYDAKTHVPVCIYPNPLQPTKYVVVNSGMTFREAHDRTNSQQIPKLPDWAILDITTPPSDTAAGRVVAADFFDETWQFKAAK